MRPPTVDGLVVDEGEPTLDGAAPVATFSHDRLYRYTLSRRWAPGPSTAFVMLNPSTADAFDDDPRAEDLPTVDDILGRALEEFDQARNSLSEAASWLRSDWQPGGSRLTPEQLAARTAGHTAVETAKAAIDEAKRVIWEALP